MEQRPTDSPGVAQVRDFYDREGWQWADGQSGDARRWGTAPRGPIQESIEKRRLALLRSCLRLAGPTAPTGSTGSTVLPGSTATGPSIVEFGGGGQPALPLLDAVSSYTAVDISIAGLEAAAAAVAHLGIDTRFVEADVRAVPLDSGQFDLAYSAHMIYHLPTEDDQRRALQEMARVVRPGGVLAVVGTNPYPLLFPGRCARRAIAAAPVLGALAQALRPAPPLPFLPMSLAWRASVLAPFGTVSTHAFGVPTPSFSRRVDESRPVGRLLWRMIASLETRHAALALRLGSFTLVVLEKAAA